MIDGLFHFSGNLYGALFFGLCEPFFLISDMIVRLNLPFSRLEKNFHLHHRFSFLVSSSGPPA